MRKILDKIDTLLKKEKGTIKKEHGGKIKVCLIYPNIYQVGISNLGFQTVYRLFNNRKDVVCERSFLPAKDDIEEYRKGFPLISFESKKPLYEFDILAFSLCFENDLPEIIRILEIAKIPHRRRERDFNSPLLIAGGVLCFSNPEPLAEVFDIILIGEAEELLEPFIDNYKKVKEASYEEDFKENLKREIIKFKGFYVPEAYREIYDFSGKIVGREVLWLNVPEKIKRVYCKNLSENLSFSQIITSEAVFSNKYLIEAMRGCPFSCRFCLVGKIYSPTRKASIDALKSRLSNIPSETCSVGLIAPSLTAYRELVELLETPLVELSFTSLRADRATLDSIDYLSRMKTVTIAPEAGSERLRKIIKKGISEKDLLNVASRLSNTEVQNLKLYFMIGLPFEKDEDVEDIKKLIEKVRGVFFRRITASISIFVPKPFTPFQWHGMETYEVITEKLKKIKKDTLQIKGFKLFHEVPKYSYLQGYLARADRRAVEILERLSKGEKNGELWEKIKKEACQIKSLSQFLPWDFIEHEGIKKEVLWDEYERAKAEAFQTDNT